MSNSDCNLSPEGEFSLDDCDALLKFPFQDYKQDVKTEKKDSVFPELGTSANWTLNGNESDFLSDDNARESTSTFSPVAGSSQSKNTDDSSIDPKTLEKCLSLNKTLQQKMIMGMAKLVDALTKNKLKQDEIIQKIKNEEKLKTMGKPRVTKPVSLFAAPYFRDIRGMVPPDNEDTKIKMKNKDVTAYLRAPRPWMLVEKDQLMHGVGANALSYVLKPYKAKRDFLKSKIKNKDITDAEISDLKKQIVRIERKMKMESERPYKDLITEAHDHIDWLAISATNLEGLRTEEECELMWLNYLSIFVNKEQFTEKEDENLKILVEKHKERNWDAVAEELQTNRSAVQCFERYQTKLNETKLKTFYTADEDVRLLELIEKYRIGNFIPWNKICGEMEGRARHQVINRYERTLCIAIKRGPWSKEEDAMLIACVGKFGKHWTKMQDFFPGRTVYSVRERYVGHMDPDLRIGNWSKAEDIQLIKLVKQHGYGKWGLICKGLPGRTDNMCLCRTRRLMFHSLSKTKKDPDFKFDFTTANSLVNSMKPVASSKICMKQNTKLRQAQNIARETLHRGLEKIAHLTGDPIDLETLDLSTLSTTTLRHLLEEFNSTKIETTTEVWRPTYQGTGYTRKFERPMLKPRNKKRKQHKSTSRDCNEESDFNDDDVKEESEEDDFSFTHVEKVWLQKVLDNKYKEEANTIFNNNPKNKKIVCLNGKESMESSLYQTFLQKELLCKKYLEDDNDNFVCGKIDYNVSLGEVTRHFIQPPPSSEKEMLVLPPNFSTIYGMDMIFTSQDRLKRTANFVDHSMPYVRYATGFSNDLPKCVACSVKDSEPKPSSSCEEMMNKMKNSLLIVDEVMEREAMIETRELGKDDQQCQCSALAQSKSEVDLLAKRFISMFLWPYLLSSVGVSEEQEQMVYKSDPVKYDATATGKVGKHKGRPTKRKAESSAGSPSKKRANVEEQPIEEDDKPPVSETPTRKSARSCVLQRKSFAFKEEEEE